MAAQPEVYFSRWLPPPSWISKIGCHFFTIGPIPSNLMGMLRIWHRTQLLHWKCIFTKIQDGGRPPSWISKISCYFFTIWTNQLPNLMGMLRIVHRTQLFHLKVHIHQNSRWRTPPSWISKIRPSLANDCHLSGIMIIWQNSWTVQMLLKFKMTDTAILNLPIITIRPILTKFVGNNENCT